MGTENRTKIFPLRGNLIRGKSWGGGRGGGQGWKELAEFGRVGREEAFSPFSWGMGYLARWRLRRGWWTKEIWVVSEVGAGNSP